MHGWRDPIGWGRSGRCGLVGRNIDLGCKPALFQFKECYLNHRFVGEYWANLHPFLGFSAEWLRQIVEAVTLGIVDQLAEDPISEALVERTRLEAKRA
jgi:hypothetical protein